jgi:hypothetical protein
MTGNQGSAGLQPGVIRHQDAGLKLGTADVCSIWDDLLRTLPRDPALGLQRKAGLQESELSIPRRLISLPFLDLLLQQESHKARQGYAPVNR